MAGSAASSRSIFVLAMLTAALSVASVFARRRGASAELRKQLAWLGYVGLMTALWVVVLLISGWRRMLRNGPVGTIILRLHRDNPGRGHPAGLRGGGAEVPAV